DATLPAASADRATVATDVSVETVAPSPVTEPSTVGVAALTDDDAPPPCGTADDVPVSTAASEPIDGADGAAPALPPKPKDETAESEIGDYDPGEPFNERMFEFNRKLDRYVLKPVATGYDKIMPDELQRMISNAFDNIRFVPRFVNSVLQRKWGGAGRELSR